MIHMLITNAIVVSYILYLLKSHREYFKCVILFNLSCYWLLFVRMIYYLCYAAIKMPQCLVNLEVSVLSGDQLMYQSMKCEPPETPPESTIGKPSANSPASPGLLITPTGGYKVPEASNNWKAEVKRIWNKPVEQLPIGIDLPRLATSMFVPALEGVPALVPPAAAAPAASEAAPAAEAAPVSTAAESTEASKPVEAEAPATPAEDTKMASPPASPRASADPATEAAAPALAAAPAPPAEDVDIRAREILHSLTNIARFVEGDEYALNLIQNFGNFVVIDGAKDRDMSREISKLVTEYLGKESKVVKVLKACNQAIIAPAVIELTLNVCAKVPFKDAGGWRMELSKNADGIITVTHIKQQKSRSSNKEEEFAFEWHLEIIFDEQMNGLSELYLSIPKLNFGPSVSQTTMEGIQYTFAPYLVRR